MPMPSYTASAFSDPEALYGRLAWPANIPPAMSSQHQHHIGPGKLRIQLPEPRSSRAVASSALVTAHAPAILFQTTPETASKLLNGLAKRYRSASVKRSGGAKLGTVQEYATPQLGKRKRGSRHAQDAGTDDGEADQLSLENYGQEVRSIEKTRRVPAHQSLVLEEADEAPDELSMLDNSVASHIGKGTARVVEASLETPLPKAIRNRGSNTSIVDAAPIAPTTDRAAVASFVVEQEPPRTGSVSSPTVLPLETPVATRLTGSQDHSTASKPHLNGPNKLINAEEESEDELGPPQPACSHGAGDSFGTLPPRDEVNQTIQILETLHGQIRLPNLLNALEPDQFEEASPEARAEEVEVNELSPEVDRTKREPLKANTRQLHAVPIFMQRPESIVDEAMEQDDEEDKLVPRPAHRQRPKPAKAFHERLNEKSRKKTSDHEPPKKKVKLERGPTESMGLKGFAVKGLTVVDTTRTIINKVLDQRLQRFVEQKNGAKDGDHARTAKRNINHFLAYRDNFEKRILELQDANGSLNLLHSKDKQYKREARTCVKST
ncbi:uncharacterized protein BDR25DRAFT_393403 [Lindgomyces ingoldianus]|uniref:Uncharacterized protein n=1 Tax=Lindgomyces ingoldianus TaxID=673940 RepID=A0ACB6QW25_9PLEO|nr:uncharacterized protein BDR25DRAFT_393403 [Lindgomyces ingoldianus]KAF2471219.1 hypothetical protein BDR25DRAFT_393403 [Lindgomyces ingoldianus]